MNPEGLSKQPCGAPGYYLQPVIINVFHIIFKCTKSLFLKFSLTHTVFTCYFSSSVSSSSEKWWNVKLFVNFESHKLISLKLLLKPLAEWIGLSHLSLFVSNMLCWKLPRVQQAKHTLPAVCHRVGLWNSTTNIQILSLEWMEYRNWCSAVGRSLVLVTFSSECTNTRMGLACTFKKINK